MTRSLDARERTRHTLLTSALRRFLDKGAAAPSVADIATDAGVTQRTFYRYFPSKEHVLFSDYDARLDWFRAALRVCPAREPLVVAIRADVESFPYDDALLKMAQLRTRELEVDVINAQLRRVQADFADEIVEHLRRLRKPSDAEEVEVLLPERLRAQIISLAMYTALDNRLASGADDFEYLDHLIDSALGLIAEGLR